MQRWAKNGLIKDSNPKVFSNFLENSCDGTFGFNNFTIPILWEISRAPNDIITENHMNGYK